MWGSSVMNVISLNLVSAKILGYGDLSFGANCGGSITVF
jgi:hypothetical protein